MTGREGFDEFVTGRSTHLLRTAYLLTGDRERAPDLVDDALARACKAWSHLDDEPETFVRNAIVRGATSGQHPTALQLRRGSWAGRHPAGQPREPARPSPGSGAGDAWSRLQRLDPRLRAVAVLHSFERLTDDDVAHALPGIRVAEELAAALDALALDEPALAELLRDRADDVGDGPEPEAVRRVVGAARRRRGRWAALLGVAAAAAVGLALGPSVLAGDDAADGADPPPPATLAGQEIPGTLTATGFTYDYTQGYESEPLDRELTVRLPRSDEPRLVIWASTPPRIAAFVTATIDGQWRARHAAGSVEGYEQLAPGAHEVVLSQSGVGLTERLAVAVYTLSETPPPGVGDGRTVFRETVLGERLAAATVGDAGDGRAEVEVTLPEGALRVAVTCYGTDAHEVRVALGDRDVASGSCSEQPQRDPGAHPVGQAGSTAQVLRPEEVPGGLRPGESTVLGVRLVEPDGSPAEHDEAVVGAALYTDLVPRVPVVGVGLPVRVEIGGHTWRYAGVPLQQPRGWPGMTLAAGPGDPARLYVAVVGGRAAPGADLTWDVLVDAKVVETVTEESGRGGATFSPYAVVVEGDHRMLEVVVTRGAGEATRVTFAAYDRVSGLR